MRNTIYKMAIVTFLCLFINSMVFGEKKGDHEITGKIKCNNEVVPYATILVKGTTIGTASDDKGYFKLQGLPEGTFVVRAQAVGFKPVEKEITIKGGGAVNLNLELKEDAIGLEQVVVTADRNEKNRKEASVIVNTLTSKALSVTQSNSLCDGLNFCPGLRMENNCQNCGFTQLRMNGMEGAYSQILVNSRPIFSGLAGVYGLELIPANMIERTEVIRGGGSALYGSNAIAGTVNVITKDPTNNSYKIEFGNGVTGVGVSGADAANDYHTNFNTSFVTDDGKTGLSLFGSYRNKEHFDANDDGFSEISDMKNTTIGARFFHRFNYKTRLTADFFNINEKRRGGNKFDLPEHEADIAESVKHEILTGALSFDYFIGADDILSVYASGQKVNRDSYYGAGRALNAYGNTNDFTYSTGVQFKGKFDLASLVSGVEYNGGHLKDEKLGFTDFTTEDLKQYPNELIAKQEIRTIGAFAQYDYQLLPMLKASVGLRYDNYKISDKRGEAKDVTGNVLSPRLNLLYDVFPNLQARVSFSKGYRAPQIFDEDLHIESSEARKVSHVNSPDLKQETSNSYTFSLDYNKKFNKVQTQLLIEGFYTRLDDPFMNEISKETITEGTGNREREYTHFTYTRVNGKDHALVKGVNIELNVAASKDLIFKSGFTFQKSEYGNAQEDFGKKSFYRTPDNYGFLSVDAKLYKRLRFSATGNYTGSMFVPYYGTQLAEDVREAGQLRNSDDFFDVGAKLRYCIKMKESKIQLYAGIKNIFNSYQDDFDKGGDRDPGYIYGPANPRTFYFGIKIGNLLN